MNGQIEWRSLIAAASLASTGWSQGFASDSCQHLLPQREIDPWPSMRFHDTSIDSGWRHTRALKYAWIDINRRPA